MGTYSRPSKIRLATLCKNRTLSVKSRGPFKRYNIGVLRSPTSLRKPGSGSPRLKDLQDYETTNYYPRI
jgi:hypothetical protein